MFSGQPTALVIGDDAGKCISFPNLEYTTIAGVRAGELAENGKRLTAFGFEALREGIGSSYSVAFGTASAAHAPYAWGLTALGYSALRYGQWSEQTVAVGLDAGRNAHHCPECIFIGTGAGKDAHDIQNSICIGQNSKVSESHTTEIGNDRTQRTIIRGKLNLYAMSPLSPDSPGMPGDITWDEDAIYVHVGKGWRRAELKSFKP